MIYASTDVANTSYLWIYVLIGIFTFAGFGVAVIRWLRKSGIRDSKIDELIDPDTGVMAQLAEITKSISPNGKHTQGLGDIAARIEDAVTKTNRTLDRHIGACEQAHDDLQRQIDRKQDKGTV